MVVGKIMIIVPKEYLFAFPRQTARQGPAPIIQVSVYIKLIDRCKRLAHVTSFHEKQQDAASGCPSWTVWAVSMFSIIPNQYRHFSDFKPEKTHQLGSEASADTPYLQFTHVRGDFWLCLSLEARFERAARCLVRRPRFWPLLPSLFPRLHSVSICCRGFWC